MLSTQYHETSPQDRAFDAEDARLNVAYQALLASLNSADRKALRAEERTWIRGRDKGCAKGKNYCKRIRTANRADELERRMGGLASISGERGNAFTAETHPIDIPELVREVMTDAYGDTYGFSDACWAIVFEDDNGEYIEYCMRSGDPVVVETGAEKAIYFHAFSATDIKDDPHYSYSQAQPGLMGAFKIQLDDSSVWKYKARHGVMDYGTAGDCGCSRAKLVKLDNSGKYGWIFASGGTWQGVTVSNFSIVTDINGEMKDVSRIPQVREAAQDVKYEVSVKADSSFKGMLPLHVVAKKDGTVDDEFDIAFDPTTSLYALPSAQ